MNLPSEVQKKDIKKTLYKIKSKNRSLGQLTGKRSIQYKNEKLMIESQKETMKLYKNLILGIAGAQNFFQNLEKDLVNINSVD